MSTTATFRFQLFPETGLKPRPESGILPVSPCEFNALWDIINRANDYGTSSDSAVRTWLVRNGWDARSFEYLHTTLEVVYK